MELAHEQRPRPDQLAAQRDLVAWVERYIRQHKGRPVSISALCELVGRSERTLRNAFYGVHGMSPKRWIRAERLAAARRALRDLGNTPATVTGIATEFGFYELGRFAGIYREAFGERPSATLRGSRQHGLGGHLSTEGAR